MEHKSGEAAGPAAVTALQLLAEPMLHHHHLQLQLHQTPYAADANVAAFAFGEELSAHNHHQQRLSDDQDGNLLDDAAASPTGSSSSSSRDKWHPKRHVCELPDCGKSFDSKWALIRCVASAADLSFSLARVWHLQCVHEQTHPCTHGREAVPVHVSRLRQVVRGEVGHDAVRTRCLAAREMRVSCLRGRCSPGVALIASCLRACCSRLTPAPRSHLQTHSRDKPFKCTYSGCSKSFKGKDYLGACLLAPQRWRSLPPRPVLTCTSLVRRVPPQDPRRRQPVRVRAPDVLQDVLQPQEPEEAHPVVAQPGREEHIDVRVSAWLAVCRCVGLRRNLLAVLGLMVVDWGVWLRGLRHVSREQQLRERIIKMATRNKEKTRKFEATIRNLMDENETLKRRMAELEKALQLKRP
ncbi:hypothetical protein PybrP1_000717 [[Pythium] brassicae (nom. inval.)]|nr:hypothetical protein PybrP1_000717 [[Pythium] brassicae (nom. inval.)]